MYCRNLDASCRHTNLHRLVLYTNTIVGVEPIETLIPSVIAVMRGKRRREREEGRENEGEREQGRDRVNLTCG